MNFKCLLIIINSFIVCSPIMDKTLSEIEKKFPNNISIQKKMYKIDKDVAKSIQNKVRQKFFRKELNCWHIISDDSSNYFAILDNVKGKSLPITFLTIFDENKQVYDSEIIKYREGYGGEVANKSWLNQFINYTDSSDYKVGGAISGISGATISVNSVTKGINKLTILVDYIIDDFNE